MKQPPQKGEIVIYRTEDGKTALDVTLEAQTVWLSLNQMVTLFQRDKSVVSRHLNNITGTRGRELVDESRTMRTKWQEIPTRCHFAWVSGATPDTGTKADIEDER